MNDSSGDRAIGRIEGKLDLIIQEQSHAVLSRKEQYQRLEAIDRKVDFTASQTESIEKRLKAVEEPVAEFSRWRERGVGAIMLMSLVAAMFGGLIGAFGKKIWAAITG